MTDENNNINELLKKNMVLNLYTYNYSTPVTMVKDSLITLFSDENWRLSHNVNRFEPISPEQKSSEINITDLENSINERRDVNNVPSSYHSEFDPDLVMLLVDELNQLDFNSEYTACTFDQYAKDSYEVLNDDLLIEALKKEKKTHYRQLVPVKEDNNTFIVDLEYNKVMKQIPHIQSFQSLCSVLPFLGSEFNSVSPQSVSAVLYALSLGISNDNIKKSILYPTMTPDELANAQLMYLKYCHSAINDLSEEAAADNIGFDAIDEDDSNPAYDCYFYNPDSEEQTTLIAHDDIDSALTYIYHKEYDPELNADQHKLTNALIDLADKHNLSIQRQLRRKSTLSQISHVDFENKKITSYDSELTKDYGNNCWIESVFNVIEKDTKNQVMYDMTIGQLFSYIVSLDYPSLEE